MSQTSISLIWRAFGLQPHRADSFKLSTDPFFIDKVRDVRGSLSRPAGAGCGAHVWTRRARSRPLNRFSPVLPMMPGTPERRQPRLPTPWDHEPVRRIGHGIGKVIGSLAPTSTGQPSSRSSHRIDQEVPDGLDVHLILDNYGTHKDTRHSPVATQTPRGSTAFHANIGLVAQTWWNGGSAS